jgi:hypothetical protein
MTDRWTEGTWRDLPCERPAKLVGGELGRQRMLGSRGGVACGASTASAY